MADHLTPEKRSWNMAQIADFYQNLLPYLAEDVGFEPTGACTPADFKSATIDHSDNPP